MDADAAVADVTLARRAANARARTWLSAVAVTDARLVAPTLVLACVEWYRLPGCHCGSMHRA